ncbi:metal-dependent hydrolase [Thiolapillus sp.]
MANGATHTAVGALTGLAMAVGGNRSKGEDFNPLLAIGTSTAFAKLPDLIEPAIHPHHRQFFHSIGFLVMIGCGLKKVYDWQPDGQAERILRFLTLCAGAGYISHLVLDGFTPRFLPLHGKV